MRPRDRDSDWCLDMIIPLRRSSTRPKSRPREDIACLVLSPDDRPEPRSPRLKPAPSTGQRVSLFDAAVPGQNEAALAFSADGPDK